MCLSDDEQKAATSLQLVIRTKEQNRSVIGSNPDQSLPRSKILRGKRNFQRLFERSTVLKRSPLLCRFRVYENPQEGCMFGFIAPKKLFRRAVDRNRVKRWIREAFRLNQHLLPKTVLTNTFGFHAVFIAISNNLSYATIESQMISLLQSITDSLTANSGTTSTRTPKDTE
ncbi:ribonuclease P protein component [Rhodohalobacter sp. 8-1]|uniref:ribonuclease P protein component n=1 Tax=Rhodohalobacter sp. 8-1 TaxID=3131972 RepID=UPI0030EEA034